MFTEENSVASADGCIFLSPMEKCDQNIFGVSRVTKGVKDPQFGACVLVLVTPTDQAEWTCGWSLQACVTSCHAYSGDAALTRVVCFSGIVYFSFVKISDFGLSCEIKDAKLYVSRGRLIPIRWTAPEVGFKRILSLLSPL